MSITDCDAERIELSTAVAHYRNSKQKKIEEVMRANQAELDDWIREGDYLRQAWLAAFGSGDPAAAAAAEKAIEEWGARGADVQKRADGRLREAADSDRQERLRETMLIGTCDEVRAGLEELAGLGVTDAGLLETEESGPPPPASSTAGTEYPPVQLDPGPGGAVPRRARVESERPSVDRESRSPRRDGRVTLRRQRTSSKRPDTVAAADEARADP